MKRLKTKFCKQKISIPLAILIALIISLSNAAGANTLKINVIGNGKPVILIPGLMSDQRVWKDLADELSTTNSVHLVNIAGFGATPAIEGQSLAGVKREIQRYIVSNQLRRPAVIGHSLGGFMAFWLASENPDSIGPIVSVDGLPFIGPLFTQSNQSTVDSIKPQAEMMKTMYATMSQQQLVSQTRYGLNRQAISNESKQMILDMASSSEPSVVGEAIVALMSLDLRSALKSIKTKVLLLGASGGFTEESDHLRMKNLYNEQLVMATQAKLVMNSQVRHFIMLDDSAWLTKQVTDFLNE
jgi:pimeloyl-ACP methyl ester carboxylesterase